MWEPGLLEYHHFRLETADWAPRESRSVTLQVPVHHQHHIPVFCSPFPGPQPEHSNVLPSTHLLPLQVSPAHPTCSRMAKGTRTEPGSCFHP